MYGKYIFLKDFVKKIETSDYPRRDILIHEIKETSMLACKKKNSREIMDAAKKRMELLENAKKRACIRIVSTAILQKHKKKSK